MRAIDKPRRGADGRPRIHLWPVRDGWSWSAGATGWRSEPVRSAGLALNQAMLHVDGTSGVVVIVEAAEERR